MSRRTPLTSQTRHLNIVIRKNIEIPVSKIKAYCDDTFERYAFIEHKGDIKPDTGVVEGVHYHIVGDTISSKVRLSTRLSDIVKYFKFDNENGLEIEQYRTFEGSLQYLTHKNQPEKTPHNKVDIITNLDKADFDILYDAEVGNVITFDLLYLACVNANNIIEVIKELGISNYRTYRAVIWDIWNSLNGNPETIKKM